MESPHPQTADQLIIGFDPGREKCGIALLDPNFHCLYRQVILTGDVMYTLQHLCTIYPVQLLVIGDQTSSKDWQKRLQADLSSEIAIRPVDERYTSQEARSRYWLMHPPKGLCRLIPTSMRVPPCPIDDIVAVLLVERFLATQQLPSTFQSPKYRPES